MQVGWCDVPARAYPTGVDYHDPAQNYWRDRLVRAQVGVHQSGCRHGLSLGSWDRGCTQRSTRKFYCEAKLTAEDIAPLKAIAAGHRHDDSAAQCAALLIAELEALGIEKEQERSCRRWYAPWKEGPH